MDIKTLKQNVCVNSIITKQLLEQGIDTDFTLPDYCAGISRILKCKLIPRVLSKNISGQNLTIDVTVTVLLIYADENNCIFSYEHTVPFVKNIELNSNSDNAHTYCRVRTSYANCRAVTQRKVDVHGAVELDVKVVAPKDTEIITDADNAEIQLKRGNAPSTSPMGFCEKSLIIEQEIELSQGQPEIQSIIRCDAVPAITDCKVISGKVLLKGELCVTMLYCPVDSTRPVISRSSTPFSQIMDIDGVHEDCRCDNKIEVAYFELKPKTSMSGDTRSVMLNAKLMVATNAYCESDIPVILDAYSTKHKSEIIKDDITFEKITHTVNESYVCKKTLEFSDDALGSVLDMWCDTKLDGVRTEENALIICGSVQVCMLVYDAASNATYQERPIEFEYRHNLNSLPLDMRCEPQLEVLGCSFTITGENTIEVQVELRITAAVYEIKKLPLIVDLKLSDEPQSRAEYEGGIVVYYADSGEQIWDIARKYNSSVDEIMQINTIDSDILTCDKALLIPIA